MRSKNIKVFLGTGHNGRAEVREIRYLAFALSPTYFTLETNHAKTFDLERLATSSPIEYDYDTTIVIESLGFVDSFPY